MSFPDFRFCIYCLQILSRIIIIIFLRHENLPNLPMRISKIRQGVEKFIWTTSFYPRASEAGGSRF